MSCIQMCRTFRIIEISSITSYVTLAGSAHALYPLKEGCPTYSRDLGQAKSRQVGQRAFLCKPFFLFQ